VFVRLFDFFATPHPCWGPMVLGVLKRIWSSVTPGSFWFFVFFAVVLLFFCLARSVTVARGGLSVFWCELCCVFWCFLFSFTGLALRRFLLAP